jgi:hypothetical protein
MRASATGIVVRPYRPDKVMIDFEKQRAKATRGKVRQDGVPYNPH